MTHEAYQDYADWPRHVVGPNDGFRVWYLEPATLLVAVSAPEITAALLDDYLAIADEIRRIKADEIEAAGGIASILDWRHSSFTTAARERSKQYYETSGSKGRIRARFMTLSDDAKYRMNHRVLSMNASLMKEQIPIRGVSAPSEAIAVLGAQPPKLDPEILALRSFFAGRGD